MVKETDRKKLEEHIQLLEKLVDAFLELERLIRIYSSYEGDKEKIYG